jgi:hypothetical protein
MSTARRAVLAERDGQQIAITAVTPDGIEWALTEIAERGWTPTGTVEVYTVAEFTADPLRRAVPP